MDVKKQPTKIPFQILRNRVSFQAGTVRSDSEQKSKGRLRKIIVQCASFLTIFIGVKALINTNVEARTWLIYLELAKFPPHHRLAPSEHKELFLYVSAPASRLRVPEHRKCPGDATDRLVM